jgi:hypothetical protein
MIGCFRLLEVHASMSKGRTLIFLCQDHILSGSIYLKIKKKL